MKGNRKVILLPACIGASLPLIGWLWSLGLSLHYEGKPFAWFPMAYAPLGVIATPLQPLLDLFPLLSESHPGVFIFALLSSAIYALTFTGAACVMRRILQRKPGTSHHQPEALN